ESETRAAIRRGNEKFAKQQYESALKEYQDVPITAGDDYAQALYNVGVCYYELWRTQEAIEFYRKALDARRGEYPKAWFALGVALEDQAQPAAAKDAYRQS